MPDVTDRLVYWATYWPQVAAGVGLFGIRVAGRRNLPAAGPALLVCNHTSFLDPWLVGVAARRRLCYLARHTLFGNPAFGRVIRAFGAVPIDRGFGKEGLQQVFAQLAAGKAVVVFPEGERSPTGELQPLKAGIGLLLKKADCPVVPVGLSGPFAVWPRHATLPDPEPVFGRAGGRAVGVAFGDPFAAGELRALGRDGLLDAVAGRIRAAATAADAVRRKAADD